MRSMPWWSATGNQDGILQRTTPNGVDFLYPTQARCNKDAFTRKAHSPPKRFRRLCRLHTTDTRFPVSSRLSVIKIQYSIAFLKHQEFNVFGSNFHGNGRLAVRRTRHSSASLPPPVLTILQRFMAQNRKKTMQNPQAPRA